MKKRVVLPGVAPLMFVLVAVGGCREDYRREFPDAEPPEPEVIDVLGTQGYSFTAGELNELATRCDVDFSVMWESTD